MNTSSKTPEAAIRLVRSYLDAANRHDIDAALGYLAGTFVFREEGAEDGWDRASMRAIFEWDSVIDSRAVGAELQWTEAEGGRVEGHFQEHNRLYEALGVAETRCRLSFRVDGGKIVEQVITHLPGDGPGFDEAVTPFLEWLGEEDPDAFDELLPEGEVLFRGDLAGRWLELIANWKEETGRVSPD